MPKNLSEHDIFSLGLDGQGGFFILRPIKYTK